MKEWGETKINDLDFFIELEREERVKERESKKENPFVLLEEDESRPCEQLLRLSSY